jgi:hypothetical protein
MMFRCQFVIFAGFATAGAALVGGERAACAHLAAVVGAQIWKE